jgi:hypothetical protein
LARIVDRPDHGERDAQGRASISEGALLRRQIAARRFHFEEMRATVERDDAEVSDARDDALPLQPRGLSF